MKNRLVFIGAIVAINPLRLDYMHGRCLKKTWQRLNVFWAHIFSSAIMQRRMWTLFWHVVYLIFYHIRAAIHGKYKIGVSPKLCFAFFCLHTETQIRKKSTWLHVLNRCRFDHFSGNFHHKQQKWIFRLWLCHHTKWFITLSWVMNKNCERWAKAMIVFIHSKGMSIFDAQHKISQLNRRATHRSNGMMVNLISV